MTSTDTPTPTSPAWTADENRVADVARARVTRANRGTGYYPVTVGGYVIGHVLRQTTRAIGRVETEWTIFNADGAQLPGAYTARWIAVRNLARLEGLAAYRDAAIEGTFGYPERDRVLAGLDTAAPADADVPTTMDAVTGVFTAWSGRYRVTLTPPASDKIDDYWTDTRAADGHEYGDPMAVRLRGEDPANYVGRVVAALVAVDSQQADDAAAPGCDYFLLCDRPAVGTLPNPVLGPVNTCQRCADRMGAGDRLTPFTAR